MSKTRAALLALVLASGAAAVVVPAGPASAAGACWNGAVGWKANDGDVLIGPFKATTRCKDINMRLTKKGKGDSVVACVIFAGQHVCDPENTGLTSNWKVVSENVPNGTKFTVRIRSELGLPAKGEIAF